MYDYDTLRNRILDALIDWERHKSDNPNAVPKDELGHEPLSQSRFAWHTWREYLPECTSGFGHGSGGYDYVKDMYRTKSKQFEATIAEVFQELEQTGVITIASPHDYGGGIAMYGHGLGGTPSHHYELTRKAASFVEFDKESFLTMMNLPKVFASLSTSVETFLRKHGPYDKNVFLIMPFGDDPVLANVRTALSDQLKSHGLNLFRADDKEYEGGLWDNICVHMLGCKRAIALFKEVKSIPYNHNVAIEIGFMLGHRKQVLVLKDHMLPKLPVDLIHHLYHAVDFSDTASVEREVESWL